MLDSQLATIEEPPLKGEEGIVTVDINAPADEVSKRAVDAVKKYLGM